MACFTKDERQSFTNFLKMGFVDTFRHLYPGKIKYSFWDIRDKSRRENKGWRLDYVLTSKFIIDAVTDSEIHNEFWGSDHCPVSITIDISKIDLAKFREYQMLGDSENEDSKSDFENDDIMNDDKKSELDYDEFDQNEGAAAEIALHSTTGGDYEDETELTNNGRVGSENS